MEGKREFDLVIEEISDEINVMTGASFSGSCSTSTSCGSIQTRDRFVKKYSNVNIQVKPIRALEENNDIDIVVVAQDIISEAELKEMQP